MRFRKLQPPPLCAWCDAPSVADVLCPGCRACNDRPPSRCAVNQAHAPTLGPSCAECAYEAERRARVELVNAPFVAQLYRIREQLIAGWHRPWLGCEHGKAIVGMSIDAALVSLGASPHARA